MEVYVYPRRGNFLTHTFRAGYSRSRCSDAVQDTAHFASARLCQMHEDDLLGSPFLFYPSLQEILRYPEIFEIRVDDPRLTHQVQLMQAMTASLTSAVYEIGEL